MHITKLILCKYIRLKFNTVDYFEINPKTPIQLFIGTNGSGKSSIAYEFSPLPPDPNDFNKDGYKEVHLEFEGSFYRIKSSFGKPVEHSFIKDDVELNDGHTVTVQRELIRQHLKYTQEHHDVATGKIKFTQLTAQKRREYLTKLSNTDLTYAIGVWERLKSQHRDIQGFIKQSEKKYIQESQKLLGEEELQELKERGTALSNEISEVMRILDPNVDTINGLYHTDNQLFQIIEEIKEHKNHVLNYGNIYIPEKYKSIEDIEEDLNQNRMKSHSIENLLSRTKKEQKEIVQIIEQLTDPNISSAEKIKARIKELENRLTELKSFKKEWDFNNEDLETKLKDAMSAHAGLQSILNKLPVNPNGEKYTLNSFNELTFILAEKTNLIKHTTEINNNINTRIKHIVSSHSIDCPKCKYVWKPGVNENDLSNLNSEYEKNIKCIEGLEKEVIDLKNKIEEIEQWRSIWRELHLFKNNYPRLKDFWEEMYRNISIYNEPPCLLPLFENYTREIELEFNKFLVYKELDNLKTSLIRLEEYQTGQGITVSDRFKVLEKEHYEFVETLKSLEIEYKHLTSLIESVKQMHYHASELRLKYSKYIELELIRVKTLNNKVLEEYVQNQQKVLAATVQKYHDVKTTTEILNHLKETIEQYKNNEKLVKVLVNELSPMTGLIAEQLTGFIQYLIAQINDLISSVWNYDLIIKPCMLSEGGLDYKFPLIVKDVIKSDISESSEGIEEIINLCFRLISLVYLDIQNYPLVLDEVGKTFDPIHQPKIIDFIKTLVETKKTGQVILISHYASNHGRLSNVETLVTDDMNIVGNNDYNKHVIMN